LIASATARARRTEKARSSDRATLVKVNPGLSGVVNPITPVSRTTGTIAVPARNRRGNSRPSNPSNVVRASFVVMSMP
jgi:hypothetical protein